MASGRIYISVSGDVADNGVMTLDASGPTGGTTGNTYWLNWNAGGFIGMSWFAWNSQYTNLIPLDDAWKDSPATNSLTQQPYEVTENGFQQWFNDTQPSNLDKYLDKSTYGWSGEDKLEFAIQTGVYNNKLCFETN